MAEHRKTRFHSKASTFVIVVSVLSLLPLVEIVQLLNAYKWESTTKVAYGFRFLNSKGLLRIIYGILYFKDKKAEVGIDHLPYIVFDHSFYFLIITAAFTVLWEVFKINVKVNWSKFLTNYTFNRTDPWENMFVTSHVVLGLFTHNWIGNITCLLL